MHGAVAAQVKACESGPAADPAVLGHPVELDVIPVAEAWTYHGRVVRSTFTVSCPPDTHGELTVVGAGHDDVERTAFLPKDLLLDAGQDVTVIGVLEVIAHPPAVVNGTRVPAWPELRQAHRVTGAAVPISAAWVPAAKTEFFPATMQPSPSPVERGNATPAPFSTSPRATFVPPACWPCARRCPHCVTEAGCSPPAASPAEPMTPKEPPVPRPGKHREKRIPA